LSEEGQRIAADLGQRLSEVRFGAIYTSPLERTMETAQAVARHQKKPVVPHPGLLEINYGDWSGRTLKSLYRLQAWRVIHQSPARVRFPNGESLVEAQARAVATLEELAQRHRRQTIALVTHADVIKAAVSHYLGQPLDLYNRIMIAPASVTVLDLSEQGPVRLVTINSHGDPKSWQ
jgi:probable phosphoglycerate mutase